MSNSFRCLIVSSALSLAFCGCGKKQPAAAPLPPAPVSAEPVPVTPPSPTPPAAPAVIPATSSAEAALGTLSQAVRRYAAEKQRVPATLDEVAAAGYIQIVPQPPAGKRYVIDRKRMEVTLQ
jgi:hypothetical protein